MQVTKVAFYPRLRLWISLGLCSIWFIYFVLASFPAERWWMLLLVISVLLGVLFLNRGAPRQALFIEDGQLVMKMGNQITRFHPSEIIGYKIGRLADFRLQLHLDTGATFNFPLQDIESESRLTSLLRGAGIPPMK